jgi:putative ABC transport system permease protein
MQVLSTNFRLALRNLLRQPRRSAMAVAAVTFGIVALMLASGFIEWIYFDFRESTIHAHLGHLQIVRPDYHRAGRSDPFNYLLPASGAALDTLAKEPGVTAVAPRLFFSGLVSYGETTISFVGEAVSPGRETELSRSLIVAEGTTLRDNDPGGVLFGLGLARNLGVKVGDRVVLVVTKRSGGINAAELTIRGLFSTVTKAYDDSALRLPIDTARQLLGVQGAHAWVVLLDDTRRTEAVAASLRSRLSPGEFQVVPWYDLADLYNKTVSLFSKQVEVVRIIIAAIIVLSITNTMMMGVIERTGEIGTSLALGVRRRGILGLFICEGAILGIFGGLIGLLLGFALAALISAIGIPMPPPPGMAHGFIGQILITPRLMAEAFILAVATTLAASVFPAWKASRLAIVDALRHNR